MKTHFLLACSLAFATSTWRAHADVNADLTSAFNSLTSGRAYKKDYPPNGIATRNQLVAGFIQPPSAGQPPTRPQALRSARDTAVQIRKDSAATAAQANAAQVIAWESLETLAEGYLFAGNKDLLSAVRVSYPSGAGGTDNRALTADRSTVYNIPSLKTLGYGRAYFMQPIKDILQFMSRDKTGQVRATGGASDFPVMRHYVRFDKASSIDLPHVTYDDPNYSDPVGQASQTAARLYGAAMERVAMAATATADQLWRGAYGEKNRTSTERDAMLAEAADGLKSHIHAQFLAALPMAASLEDSSTGTGEYELALVDQARVATTSAQRLRQRILEGEKPTVPALVSSWTPADIQNQITKVQQAYNNTVAKYSGSGGAGTVLFEMARSEQAQTENFGRAATLRGQYNTRLLTLTGIDPASSTYHNLKDPVDRTAYLSAVKAKYDALVDGANTQAAGLGDGREMSGAALRLVQALLEVKSAVSRIRNYPQKLRVELERNNDVNATIVQGAKAVSAIDSAIAWGNAIQVAYCACGANSGVSVKTDTGSILAAILGPSKAMRQASDTVSINSTNSKAAIQNLLIEQQEQIDALPVVATGVDIARNELLKLYNEAQRLVEDHIWYQDATGQLWYSDPALAFRLEAAEEEYQVLLQQFRIELYKLCRMMEFAWNERFTNPVFDSSGVIGPISGLPATADDFVEAESVFAARDHDSGKKFYTTLSDWDTKLRDPQFRGPYSAALQDVNTFTAYPISLRQDIYGLVDYVYEAGTNRYVVDSLRKKKNIQEFRSILLRLAAERPDNTPNLTKIRLDFPFTYGRARLIENQSTSVPLVQRNIGLSGYDQFWNHRLKQLGMKIKGTNVFTVGTGTVPVNIEYFGNLTRTGYFADSLYTQTRHTSTFQVPLYQRDPEQRLVQEPFFGTGVAPINAAIGTTAVTLQPVADWPLFCDRVVLSITGPLVSTMKLENIEDIELTMKMEVGPPQQPTMSAF